MLDFIAENSGVLAFVLFIMLMLMGGASKKSKQAEKNAPVQEVSYEDMVRLSLDKRWLNPRKRIDRNAVTKAIKMLDDTILRRAQSNWEPGASIRYYSTAELVQMVHHQVNHGQESKKGWVSICQCITASAYIYNFEIPYEYFISDDTTLSLICLHISVSKPKLLSEHLLKYDKESQFPNADDTRTYDNVLKHWTMIVCTCQIFTISYALQERPLHIDLLYTKYLELFGQVDDPQTVLTKEDLKLCLTYSSAIMGLRIPSDWYAMNPYLYRKLQSLGHIHT